MTRRAVWGPDAKLPESDPEPEPAEGGLPAAQAFKELDRLGWLGPLPSRQKARVGVVIGESHGGEFVGTTMVLLEPGVADAFSDGASVNRALRAYLRSHGKVTKTGQAAAGRAQRTVIKPAKAPRSARA